jgi:hypothetical protein
MSSSSRRSSRRASSAFASRSLSADETTRDVVLLVDVLDDFAHEDGARHRDYGGACRLKSRWCSDPFLAAALLGPIRARLRSVRDGLIRVPVGKSQSPY